MKALRYFLLGLSFSVITSSLLAQDFSNLEFRMVGPNRGGRVTAVAGTVAAPSTFYLGASGGGVWKTEDYGTSWHNVSDGYFATPSIGDIAIAQNDANIVYVGTGSDGLRSNVINGKGVYKSIDAGQTWDHIGLDEAGLIGAVEINPENHNTVYVASIGQPFSSNDERGLYKTIDGGRSWEQVLFISDEIGISDVELLPGNPEIIFATAWKANRKPWTIISGGTNEEGGLYKSIDGGDTWERVTEGLPTGLIGKMDIAISPADSSIINVLVEAPEEAGGLYRSVDQGRTFKQMSDHAGPRNRPFYYTNIESHPSNADIIYSMAGPYHRSEDGGRTWISMRSPHADNHDMWINPNNPQLFIQSNDGGANVTHNGGETWSTQFNQATAELYQVEVDDQYPYWLYAGQQDNSTTIAIPSMAPYGVQHPNRWIVDTGGCETGPAVPKPGNHNIVYANCKGRFGVYDKRLGTEKGYYVGASNIYGHNPRDLKYRFQRVAPVHVSPHNPDVVYQGSQFVHRTTDDGRTWETISPDLTAFEEDKQVISGSPITRDITGEEYYSTIYSLRESPVQAGVIWVGANDGPVHVTQDNGASWQDVTPRRLPPGGRVDSVEPSPHDPAKAYIAVLLYQLGDWKPYIYKTENFGRSWDLLTNGRNGIPNDYPTRVVREDPEKEGVLYAGTEYGLFVSLDDGETWQSFQQNLPVTPVTDLKIIRGDLAISTMGRSFWILDNITTLRQEAISNLADSPVLFQPKNTVRYRYPRAMPRNTIPNYPQPAVQIDYYLPEGNEEIVQLEIVDSRGEVINSFYSENISEQDNGELVITDMSTNITEYIVDESLKKESGLNRFHWTMRHFGAWREEEDRRFQNGPIAAPGTYTAKLTIGSQILEQDFRLDIDPRVATAGTSSEDIKTQVNLQLQIVELLSNARRLEASLSHEQEELTNKLSNAELSASDSARLELLNEVLPLVKTADEIYPMPMLTNQVNYLYNMIASADQLPGSEATNRYAELKELYEGILSRITE